MILEYSDRKKGFNVSDELTSYYFPVRKKLMWYVVMWIAVDVLFEAIIVNALYFI